MRNSAFRLPCFIFWIVVLYGTTIHAQSTAGGFFMQLADPQMGMFEKDVSWLQESANLDFAIATANRLHPEFVVICGDLVNKRGDMGEINAFRASVGRLDSKIPLYLVAGNHDVGNVPTPKSLEEYRARLGADYYTFRAGNLFAIVLDSSLMGTAGNEREDATQLKWLEEQLTLAQSQGVREDDVVVFQHIPFFLKSADEPDIYFNVPGVSRKRYLEVLHRYKVQHVFAGHYHRNAEGVDGALSMVTTGPVGKPLGPDGSGMRLVHFAKRWESPYFDLGRLPDQTTIEQWSAGW
jgi:serine/threonine-protein phosphatase CPPED1